MTTVPIKSKIFKKGDFIKNKQRNGSFAIFEGKDSTSANYAIKHYSLALYYEPKKYTCLGDGVWGYVPSLEVSTPSNGCATDVDTDKEDYWWGLCTEEEISAALQIIYDNGYIYDRDAMTIINRKNGKTVRRLTTPQPSYKGEIIKPITIILKKALHSCIHFKRSSYSSSYGGYSNFNYGEYQDWD